jgi:hypothetical protein
LNISIIKSKAFIFCILPFLFIFFASYFAIEFEYKILKEMQSIENLVEISYDMNHLIHNLQKERGLSTNFIASEHRKFSNELASQKQNSDELILKILELKKSKNLNDYPSIQSDLEKFISKLNELKAQRGKQNDNNLLPLNNYKFYTDTIEIGLLLVKNSFSLIKDYRFTEKLNALVNLMYLKEYTGRERTLIEMEISLKEPSENIFMSLIKIISSAKLYEDYFLKNATPEWKKIFRDMIASQDIDKAKKIESDLLQSISENRVIQSDLWWQIITKKIDSLGDLEIYISMQIAQEADTSIEESEFNFKLISIIAFIVFSIELIIVFIYIPKSLKK